MRTIVAKQRLVLSVHLHLQGLVALTFLLSGLSSSHAQIPTYGNLQRQEYGDAVYREINSFWLQFFDADYNHTAVYAGIDASGVPKVMEATGEGSPSGGDTTAEVEFSDINNRSGLSYYGAYTKRNLTIPFTGRKSIVATAVSLKDAYIPYIAFDAINYSGGYVSGIRCDAFVEFSYEANGYIVWWPSAYPNDWNILNYPADHNDAPTPPSDPSYEFSPWAQRGAPGGSWWGSSPGNTYMTRPSVIKLPTYEITRVATNGYVDVTVKATDESGIHSIGYKKPGDADWSFSPTQPQHPTSDTSLHTVRVTTCGIFYYFAEDNGGNFPANAEVVIIDASVYTTNDAYSSVGGNGSVSVVAGSNCSWTATSSADWITIASEDNGTGNGSVSYSVASNESDCVPRTGTLTIAGQPITVTQAAGSGSYSLAPTGRSHGVTGESGSFTVMAGVACEWSATSGTSWITITGGETGSGNGAVNYAVDANFGVPRSGTIMVHVQTFTVHQAGNIVATIGSSPVVANGDTVRFTPTMIRAASNSVSCLWDFGDEQTDVNCEPSHVFSNCGPHEVTAILNDGTTPVTNSLMVSVICPLVEPVSLKMKSNFVPGKLDTVALSAFLDLPSGFSVTNTPVSVEVAGVVVPFTLNEKGQAVNGSSTLKLSHKGTVWQVSVKLNGDWDAKWQNYGLTNSTVTAMPITVPVLLLFDTAPPESFSLDKPLLYKAARGKSGTGQ